MISYISPGAVVDQSLFCYNKYAYEIKYCVQITTNNEVGINMNKRNIDTEIVILSHVYEVIGGAEKALVEMIEYLHRNGRTMHVVVGNKGSLSRHLKKLGINYSIMYLPFWAHGGDDPLPFQFSSLNPPVNTCLQLVELLDAVKPKLCVTNTVVVPWLAYASAIADIPHAWMIHELGSAGLNLRYAMSEEQTLQSIDTFSDIIFFNSVYTKNYYLPYLSEKKLTGIVYPGGGRVSKQAVVNPYRKNSFKIVSVGQIKPQKGQIDSVRATKLLIDSGIDAELILIGQQENKVYCQEIRNFIKKYELDKHIRLLGHRPHPEAYVLHADVAIVSSVNDAFGRVTVEAMLSKTPVVAASSAGSLEIIEDGKTGIFYNPGDEEQLASKLKYLANNTTTAEELATNAREHAASTFSDKKRFTPFINYLDSQPKRSALSLLPLKSTLEDFAGTIKLLDGERKKIALMEKSRIWKLRTKLRSLVK